MKKQTQIWKNIISLLICLTVSSTVLPSSSSAAGMECPINQKPKCEVSNCIPTRTSNGLLTQKAGDGTAQDTNCIKQNRDNSCINPYPIDMQDWGSYAGLGYRPNGAGGNPNPRNHLGNDLGTGGRTNIKALADADGEGQGWSWANGGGRTLVIRHQKGCDSGTKTSNYFTTLFRHLCTISKATGPIKKNDPVGVVGGSNYKRATDTKIDHPNQMGKCEGKSSTTSGAYALHLHYELVDGTVNAHATSIAGLTVFNPVCGDLNYLCGYCGSNTGMDSCNKVRGGGDTLKAGTGTGMGYDSTIGTLGAGTNDGSEVATGCNLGDYLNSEDCTFCNLFKVIFNTASIMAKQANDKLAAPSKDLVIIGFMIWLALYILKKIATFQAANPGDLLKGMLFQGFRVSIVVLILGGALYEVMDLTLNPVMETGLSFARSLNEFSNCDESKPYMQKVMGYDSAKGYQQNSDGGLSINLGKSIICGIKNLEDGVGFLMALGNYSICLSWSDTHNIFWVLPHLGYLLSGLVLWLAGVLLLLAFPWCLIDCILQLCIAAALIPCSIAAFAFKITSKYMNVIWNFFMNAMYNIVFMSVIIFIINSMLKTQIGWSDEEGISDDSIFIQATGNGLAWWGVGALKIFTTCFFYWCFFDEAKSMADRFAQGANLGGSKGIGRMVGGTLAQGAAKAAKPVAYMGYNAAKNTVGAVGEGINSAIGNQYRSGMNHLKGMAMQGASRIGLMNTEVTRDENGQATGYKASINLMGFKHTREVTKDADGVWTQTKNTHQKTEFEKAFVQGKDKDGNTTYQTKDGQEMVRTVDAETGNTIFETKDGQNRVVVDQNGNAIKYKRAQDSSEKNVVTQSGITNINDSFMKSRIVKDRNGNTIAVETEFKNTTAKYLVNKDGTTNMHALKQMVQGAQDKELAAAAIVKMHMEKRGQALADRFKNREVKIEKDGTIVINQLNNDGSQQVIRAKMQGDQMVISNQTTSDDGKNISQITSNGIQTRTNTYSRNKEGKWQKETNYQFSEHTHNASLYTKPLSADGVWGNGVDSQKAMKGFTEKDFDKHLTQLKYPKSNIVTILDDEQLKNDIASEARPDTNHLQSVLENNDAASPTRAQNESEQQRQEEQKREQEKQ